MIQVHLPFPALTCWGTDRITVHVLCHILLILTPGFLQKLSSMPSVFLKASGDASCVITNQLRAAAACVSGSPTTSRPTGTTLPLVHKPQDGLCACRKAGHSPFPGPRAVLSSGPEAVLHVCVSWKVCKVSPWRLAVCARVWHACGAMVHSPAPRPLGTLLSLCRTKPSHLLSGSENCVHSLGLFLGSDGKVPAKHPEL